jgi:hypothetical protein
MDSNHWLEMHYDMTLVDLPDNRNADPAINGAAFESAEARAEGLARRLEVETIAFECRSRMCRILESCLNTLLGGLEQRRQMSR